MNNSTQLQYQELQHQEVLDNIKQQYNKTEELAKGLTKQLKLQIETNEENDKTQREMKTQIMKLENELNELKIEIRTLEADKTRGRDLVNEYFGTTSNNTFNKAFHKLDNPTIPNNSNDTIETSNDLNAQNAP